MATAPRQEGQSSPFALRLPAWQRSADDWDWLREHPQVLAEHAGRWICVVDRGVVISEDDHDVFHRALQDSPYIEQAPLIMYVPAVKEWQTVRVW